jgi:predicted nucleic acid-binding protein
MSMNYVVDTCIINKLIEEKINIDKLPSNSSFFASHIQIDEINNTKDVERRACLLLKFAEVQPKIIPTESIVLGISRLNQAKFSARVLFDKLKQDLDSLNKSKANNTQDALIAETAIVNGYTLLTSDRDLFEVAEKHGGKAVHFNTV